jgi:ankyrin repeat protein
VHLTNRTSIAAAALKSQLDSAAKEGRGGAVSQILGRGATMDTSTIWSAFEAESISPGRSIPVFEALLKAGWDANDGVGHSGTPLQRAVSGGYVARATWMLDHASADPNYYVPNLGTTTLATACKASSLPMIELLLTHRAVIQNSGAMQEAAASGKREVLQLLLDRGANINEVPVNPWIEKRGSLMTPLQAAEQNGHSVIVDFLLEHGATPSGPVLIP